MVATVLLAQMSHGWIIRCAAFAELPSLAKQCALKDSSHLFMACYGSLLLNNAPLSGCSSGCLFTF